MRSDMYCHGCAKDFSIDIDMQADGNHVFKCPHCQHEHCRVVKDNVVTDERWDRRNGNAGMVYYPKVYNSSPNTSMYVVTGGCTFISDSWASSSTASTFY